jgi:hypothetical protein
LARTHAHARAHGVSAYAACASHNTCQRARPAARALRVFRTAGKSSSTFGWSSRKGAMHSDSTWRDTQRHASTRRRISVKKGYRRPKGVIRCALCSTPAPPRIVRARRGGAWRRRVGGAVRAAARCGCAGACCGGAAARANRRPLCGAGSGRRRAPQRLPTWRLNVSGFCPSACGLPTAAAARARASASRQQRRTRALIAHASVRCTHCE